MSKFTTVALAVFGLLHLLGMVLGEADLLDYHLYVGPNATAWHAEQASKGRP